MVKDEDMSKLSPVLKAAISAPFARADLTPAPKGIRSVYQRIEAEAKERNVGLMAWMTISAAATTTLNSPSSLLTLHNHITTPLPATQHLHLTEQLREISLKCLAFNGIPRTINVLTAFRSGLPENLQSKLEKSPRRAIVTDRILSNIGGRDAVVKNQKRVGKAFLQRELAGRQLWDSIYRPYDKTLIDKLADAHPDLPSVILSGGYSTLLSDPPSTSISPGSPGSPETTTPTSFHIGRVLTSLVAISCLRAQTGVGPQVISHIFGLRKAYQDGSAVEGAEKSGEEEVVGGEWLASEEGNMWILEVVDRIVKCLGGANFAVGAAAGEDKVAEGKAKL